MAIYALLIAPPVGLLMFVTGWIYGAHAYFDEAHTVPGPGDAVLALAALFAAVGMLVGGGLGLVTGAKVSARRARARGRE